MKSHVCSLWPFSAFPLCHNQVIYEIYFLFSFSIIIPASARLQREIFHSEGQYSICIFPPGCFYLPLTKCQVLVLTVTFSLVYWCVNTENFHGGIFSSLHQLWAHVDHSLCGNDSLYTPYKRVKACTPHSPDSVHSLTPRWDNLHELFIDFVFFWASECQTCHRPYQLTGPKMVKREPVERGLNANLRTFSSTSAFIFQPEPLCFCFSCSDTWKQNQLRSVFPQVGLASQQTGETGVFIRYQTTLVMSCIYTVYDKHRPWWWHLFGFTS